jgi:hypothetical protein
LNARALVTQRLPARQPEGEGVRVAQASQRGSPKDHPDFSGQTIVGELIRNMELGQFEMAYSILLPCVFSVYLNPQDHTRLSGVFNLISEDARRAIA